MKLRPAGVGGERRLMEGAAADLELLPRPVDRGDLLVAGNDLGDRLPDPPVLAQRREIDRRLFAQDPFGEVGDDPDLAPRPLVPRRAAVAEADVAEHRLLGGGLGLLVAGQDRQDDRLPAAAPGVAGVRGGAQVGDEVDPAQRPGGVPRVGIRSVEVAAETAGEAHPARVGPLDAAEGVEPRRVGQRDPEPALEPLEDGTLELRHHAHRAHALHVGVTAQGKQPAVGPPEHAAGHGQVGDHLHVRHPVLVMGDPHRPAEDGLLRGPVEVGHPLDRLAIDPGPLGEGLPRQGLEVPAKVVVVVGVLRDERLVHRPALDQGPGDRGQECNVAADVGLDVNVGDLRSEEQAADVRRHLEPHEPDLAKGVDHDDLPAPAAVLDDRPHEPRVVGGGVGADHEQQVAVMDVLEHHRGRA